MPPGYFRSKTIYEHCTPHFHCVGLLDPIFATFCAFSRCVYNTSCAEPKVCQNSPIHYGIPKDLMTPVRDPLPPTVGSMSSSWLLSDKGKFYALLHIYFGERLPRDDVSWCCFPTPKLFPRRIGTFRTRSNHCSQLSGHWSLVQEVPPASGNLGHGATLHYTRLDTIGTLFPYSLLDDRGVHYLPVVGAQNGDCTQKIYNQIIHTTSLRPDHQCSPEEGERSEPRRATNSYCPLVRCWTCDSVRTSTPSTKGLVLPSTNLPVSAS